MAGLFKKKPRETGAGEEKAAAPAAPPGAGAEPGQPGKPPDEHSGGKKPRKSPFSFLRRKKPKPAGDAGGDADAGEEGKPKVAAKPPKQKAKKKAKKKKKQKRGGIGGSRYSPVGLDIGRSSVAAVRLQRRPEGSVLVSAALDRLPEGVISGGEVQDVDALGNALKRFWRTYKIKGRKVSLGLASQKVVVRTLDFPVMEDKELRSAIEFQAQDYIPIPIDEAVFDFHVMGRFTGEDGVEKQKVLVVAAQKAVVMNFIDAMKKARLQVDGIDLQAFALLRSFSPRSFLDEGAPAGESIAIVNIAADVTNIVITADGEPQFTRITSFGGDDFTRAVQNQLGVSFAEAEELKARVGLPEPQSGSEGGGFERPPEGGEAAGSGSGESDGEETAPLPPQGPDFLEGKPPDAGGGPGAPPAPGGGEEPLESGEAEAKPDEEAEREAELAWKEAEEIDEDEERRLAVRSALEATLDSFTEEVRRSLDYYISQDESLPINRLLLSGGGSMLPNLREQLAQLFPFPVEMGDPLKRIIRNRSDLDDKELEALAPRLAIAIGLALEDEED